MHLVENDIYERYNVLQNFDWTLGKKHDSIHNSKKEISILHSLHSLTIVPLQLAQVSRVSPLANWYSVRFFNMVSPLGFQSFSTRVSLVNLLTPHYLCCKCTLFSCDNYIASTLLNLQVKSRNVRKYLYWLFIGATPLIANRFRVVCQ